MKTVFMPRVSSGLLWLCAVWILLSLHADAVLIAESKIQYCVNEGNEPIQCAKRMVVTITADANQEPGTEAINFITSAVDETVMGKPTTNFEPIQLTVRRSVVRYVYPIFYLRNFNGQPYEVAIGGSLLKDCHDDFSEDATCGLAYDATGAAVPSSQGFCCSCDLCTTVGVCPDDARAADACNLFGTYTRASCLRFGSEWFSGFEIGSSMLHYTIDLLFNSTENEEATSPAGSGRKMHGALRLSPSDVLAADTSLGVYARLIGDFVPVTAPMDLTQRMLFTPLPSSNPSEWILLNSNLVTGDGRECNKVGVSYEAFQSQGNACKLSPGSCLAGQLIAYRKLDEEAVANGGRGRYMANSFAAFSFLGSQDGSLPEGTHYLSYEATSSGAAMVNFVINADALQYVVSVADGSILNAQLHSEPLVANSRDGVMGVDIQSLGDITANFAVSVEQCSPGILPIPSQIFAVEAHATSTRQFAIFLTENGPAGTKNCTVELKDAQGSVVDVVAVTFKTAPRTDSDGAQGGDASKGGSTVWEKPNASMCDRCLWWNVDCSFSNKCASLIVAQLITLAIGGLIAFLCYRFRRFFSCCCCCCCCVPSHSSSTATDSRARSAHAANELAHRQDIRYLETQHNLREEQLDAQFMKHKNSPK